MSSITQNKHILAIASLLAITLLLWLPGGFHMTGLMEEWWQGHVASQGLDTLLAGLAGKSQFILRPLMIMPWAVSAVIPPNVIVGQNILLFLLFFGKAVALYGVIVEMLPNGRTLALFGAVLSIMFPSEEGLYSLRVLPAHMAAFLFTLSITLLLVYNRTRRWGWLIGSIAANGLNLLTYESAFAIALIAPFLLCVQTGWNRRTLATVGIHLLVTLGLLIRYAVLWATISKSYQGHLVDLGMPSGVMAALPDIIRSVGRAFAESSFNGWVDAVESVAGNSQLILPAVLVAAVCLAAGWRANRDELPSRKAAVMVFGAGIGAFVLAFIPYLPTPLRTGNERVFILSAAGAALSTVSMCLLIATLIPNRRIQFTVFSILASGLIGLAAIKALSQHQQYIDASNGERQLLASVIEAAPRIKPDTCLVMLNAPIDHRMFFYGAFWADAVGYLNDDFSLQGMFCSPGGVFACAYDPAEDAVVRVDGYRLACATERQIVFEYVPDDSEGGQVVVLDQLPEEFGDVDSGEYQPRRRIEETQPDAAMLNAVFGAWPYPK